jgi:hypothetical protein
MTISEFLKSFYFHDGFILDMRLCGKDLTIFFDLYPSDDDEPGSEYVVAKFVNVDLKTYKQGYKIVKHKRKYVYRECKYEEAWIDGRNGNNVSCTSGYDGKSNTNQFYIEVCSGVMHNCKYYYIEFTCDDVEILESKIITSEELESLYDKIYDDDSPRIT